MFMHNISELVIESLGKSFFANIANISMILFINFWAFNYSPSTISNDLIASMMLIIIMTLVQTIAKSLFSKPNLILEQFSYLVSIGAWVVTIVLIWNSEQIDLIIITNFAISSLVLINALLTNNLQTLNLIFFSTIFLLSTFFAISTSFVELKIASAFTMFLCAISLIFNYIIFKQFTRRNAAKKRLDSLLKELAKSRKEIEQKELVQSQFLASVSHDLKQPMHVINLYLGSIERILFNINMSETYVKKSSESLQKLKQSVLYMNNVLDSLLEASKLDRGLSKIKLTDLRVNPFFKKIINQHLKTTKELGLKLDFVTDLTNEITITSDSRLLERIFRNLLGNAIKYTKHGGVRIRINKKENFLNLSVIDTGLGIHPSMKKKIFNEFTQINDSNYKSGIGLGLAIVKKLSGKIGAHISLKSHLGLGSIFTLHLPTTVFNNKTDRVNVIENEMLFGILPQITTTDASETVVLVLDQDIETRNAFEILSPSLGINSITGISSENIILKTSNLLSTPKLMIIDSNNFIEEPLTAINKIQEEFNKEIPVILVTEDLENESILIKSNKKITILQKPFSSAKLQLTIQKTLAKSI